MLDMEGILRRVAKKPYRSIIDGQDVYEQICIVPEHVDRTVVTTPDGNMVSHVVQQGDCNAPATYQALMNHIFGEFIGVFMDVYLDDIIIYSETLEEHVKHVTIVIQILEKEKLYLSENKLNTYYDPWRESTTVIIRKLGKPDYSVPKAYRPIALLNTTAKLLSALITNRVSHVLETHNLLPSTHFGGCPGRSTTNSLHLLESIVRHTWRQGKVVSALFLDIEGAFPNAVTDRLLHNM